MKKAIATLLISFACIAGYGQREYTLIIETVCFGIGIDTPSSPLYISDNWQSGVIIIDFSADSTYYICRNLCGDSIQEIRPHFLKPPDGYEFRESKYSGFFPQLYKIDQNEAKIKDEEMIRKSGKPVCYDPNIRCNLFDEPKKHK